MTRWVHPFSEGGAADRYLLGGKGANLAEMTRAGLPVPPGFTLGTEACHAFYANKQQLDDAMWSEVQAAITALEARTEKRFGSADNPLLVSVRSGAPISMPGMMDTVLNLGLNDTTVQALATQTGNDRFAFDCYRRFIQMFGDVVQDIPHYRFEHILDDVKVEVGAEGDQALTASNWKKVIAGYRKLVERETGQPFPQDPYQQLRLAIEAVFRSWNNQRAIVYRRVHKIPDDLGTAVNVQSMVFGNMGDDSGTGVAFTRNPSTGDPGVFGEYLTNAQGEDVVAGTRTPKPIAGLAAEMPAIYTQFLQVCEQLEGHYRDVQDIEFTVEQGKLFLLQTRTAKRTAAAAVKVAVELVREGVIDEATAVSRVDPDQLDQLLHPRIDPDAPVEELARGLPASPGAASGRITFDADEAELLAKQGEAVLLVRIETTPEDIHGILAAQGILTSRGGMTSHAAVVARGMGKPCVCGCDALTINARDGSCQIGGRTLRAGDVISIDGATGRVLLGEVVRVQAELSADFEALLSMADDVRQLGVRANADNPEDAALARSFGAEGVGLCRTEHMFMAAGRLPVVQAMILAASVQERKEALSELLPMQQGDFYGILQAMDGLPVTIRLLDPPLHEFLPNLEQLVVRQAVLQTRLNYESEATRASLQQELGEVSALVGKVRQLHEVNPMLGHRGCRLGITFPEVYEMQARAIFQATAQLLSEGYQPMPEVMIPLVGHREELRRMKELVQRMASAVEAETGVSIPCVVGTMIEVPRAALTAGEIAQEAEFFSFGTNDLTQTTFGYSRDDAEGKFLHHYTTEKILPENPFAVLDESGVGKLIQIAAEQGRQTHPGLKLGICGEHGGEKQSIHFCHMQAIDYVSCSPYRVPLARLAAAHSALSDPRT